MTNPLLRHAKFRGGYGYSYGGTNGSHECVDTWGTVVRDVVLVSCFQRSFGPNVAGLNVLLSLNRVHTHVRIHMLKIYLLKRMMLMTCWIAAEMFLEVFDLYLELRFLRDCDVDP